MSGGTNLSQPYSNQMSFLSVSQDLPTQRDQFLLLATVMLGISDLNNFANYQISPLPLGPITIYLTYSLDTDP